MAEVKITKMDKFNMIKDFLSDGIEKELVSSEEFKMLYEFCQHEIDLINNKKNGSAGISKAKLEEQELVKGVILDAMASIMCPTTISDMQKICPELLGEFSNQKISAMLKKLVAEGKVKKLSDKKVSYFELA